MRAAPMLTVLQVARAAPAGSWGFYQHMVVGVEVEVLVPPAEEVVEAEAQEAQAWQV